MRTFTAKEYVTLQLLELKIMQNEPMLKLIA